MLQTSKVIAQGHGLAPVLLKRAATVELDWDVRQKSRFDTTDSLGRHLGVFLPRGTLLRGGDVLVVEDGSMVRVLAAPQPVLRISGMVITPVDATFEVALPEIDPNRAEATTDTFAAPPRRRPIVARARSVKNAPPPVLSSS